MYIRYLHPEMVEHDQNVVSLNIVALRKQTLEVIQSHYSHFTCQKSLVNHDDSRNESTHLHQKELLRGNCS